MNVISTKPNVLPDTDANNNIENDLNNNNTESIVKLKRGSIETITPIKSSSQTSCKNCPNGLNGLIDQELLDTAWNVRPSDLANKTCNPVRRLVEQMKIEPNPNLPMIALSIGDPTIMSDLGKPDSVTQAIINCVQDKKNDGYTHSCGSETARQAVAKFYSRPEQNVIYNSQDIYLTSGCSQALDLCIMALASKGKNILIPRPGFSIYKTLIGTNDIGVKYYQLLVNYSSIVL